MTLFSFLFATNIDTVNEERKTKAAGVWHEYNTENLTRGCRRTTFITNITEIVFLNTKILILFLFRSTQVCELLFSIVNKGNFASN